ncbi:MAG: hypothetical protein LBP73_09210 [Clostridiales Family XIII bacterium]|jgi:hypothetical protein|nr:hypothetical protein [Clostridiales Family XIII bacterium]
MHTQYREKAFARFVEIYATETEKAYAAALAARGDTMRREDMRALASIFSSLCQKAACMQKDGALGEVKDVCFSFLHTFLPEGKGVYRIDIRDDDWLTQERECAAYWSAAFAFEPFFSVFAEQKQRAFREISYIGGIDMDHLAFYMANDRPRKLADAAIETRAPVLTAFDAYARLRKADGCRFSLGEYRDETRVIHR